MLKEFKEFALRGNMLDVAVGIIIGAAFGTIVNSLVNDIIMPPVGLILGNVDFADIFLLLKPGTPGGPYASLAEAEAAGAVTVNLGVFINSFISFLIVAVVLFFLIRAVNQLKRKKEAPPPEPTTKECPYCLSTIPIQARRCAYCTSDLQIL